YVPCPEKTSAEFPLLLTTGRVLEQWHTGTMTERIPELAKGSGPALLEISPEDAWWLKVADGDTVEIKSRYGSVKATARVKDGPRPGVVFAAFYDAKLLINRAVADTFDPFSKEPEFKVTAVAVSKV